MNKQELMCSRVVFNKKLERIHIGPYRKYAVQEIEEQHGWIVGFRTVPNGKIKKEQDGFLGNAGFYKEFSYNRFVPTSHVQCTLISRTPYENPLKVPMDGFRLASTQPNKTST